jgi:hypothetical protein
MLRERRVLPIHPSFRMIAIASAPLSEQKTSTASVTSSGAARWLTQEVASMFTFAYLPRPDYQVMFTFTTPSCTLFTFVYLGRA